MKFWAIILPCVVNFNSTRCKETIKQPEGKTTVTHSEMNFLHSKNVHVEQRMAQHGSAYLGFTSAQGASRSHAMDVYRHRSQNYLSADYNCTVRCKKPSIEPPCYDGTTSLSQFRQSARLLWITGKRKWKKHSGSETRWKPKLAGAILASGRSGRKTTLWT